MILEIVNRGTVPVDVEDIQPIGGAEFTILEMTPTVPATIDGGKMRRFALRLARFGATTKLVVKRPYVRVSVGCAGG